MRTTEPATPQPASDDVRVRRLPERADYDRATIDAIIDAALVAHVATVRDGAPVVVPMLAVRDGDWLLLHGAPGAGTFRRGRGQQIAVSMALLDGLVLARSGFHHSLNYRSVVVVGEAEVIRDEGLRRRALDVFVDNLVPGRVEQIRPMTDAELKQTAVVRISLEAASAKVRSGPPGDDEEDYALPIWAGVLPVRTVIGEPESDPRLSDGVEVPEAVRAMVDTAR